MIDLLRLPYLLPLAISIFLAIPKKWNEKTITRLTAGSLIFPAVTTLIIWVTSLSHGNFPFEHKLGSFLIFSHAVPVILWFDKFTVAMLLLTHILGLLVVKYSHGYLHLEKGYQRFFSTTLFFIFGMYVLAMAGTIDLFFAGWEVVGFSSFLLIAFYRAHTRSVLNAWRIYNIYRICDVGLLLSAVIGHIIWHETTKFSFLASLTPESFTSIGGPFVMIMSLLLIFASLGKSAQFPFHNWPSRAMEGPTPSSAIFYGALSIHAGVFLLIRTEPLWRHSLITQIIVGTIGFITLVLSLFQGRVQSNIKGQIAFAITSQIGLMFIELSFGLVNLAMIHLFAHALFRCFQLLVSPSIVANSLIMTNKVVMDRLEKSRKAQVSWLPKSLSNTLYVLSMNDFSMDVSWRGFSFIPWKSHYRIFTIILRYPLFVIPFIFLIVYLAGVNDFLPVSLASVSFFMVLRSILVQHNPLTSVLEFTFGLLLGSLGTYLLNEHFFVSICSYMVSVFPCLLVSIGICYKFRDCDLRNFHALGTNNAFYANAFFVCFLVISGMPVSSAFFGEDMLLVEIIGQSPLMAVITTLSLMMNGLLFVKIYTRIFMGQSQSVRDERFFGVE